MQAPEREQIPGWSEAGNLPERDTCDVGMVTKRLSLVDVREMYLDGGQPNRCNGIADRDARMCIGGRVDNNPVESASGFLNPCHQFAFAVGLPDVDRHRQLLGQFRQRGIENIQRGRPIDGLFPRAEEIEVGTM